VQTIRQDHNERLYRLLKEFDAITGVPVLLNTSFNVKGEPIVETPKDANSLFPDHGHRLSGLARRGDGKETSPQGSFPDHRGVFGSSLACPHRFDRRRTGSAALNLASPAGEHRYAATA
jgi:hypothetical protein